MCARITAPAREVRSAARQKPAREIPHCLQRAIAERPHFGSHDNVNFPERVFSQRLHNQSRFISGSAGTIWVLPVEALLPPDISSRVKEARLRASEKPFSIDNLLGDNTPGPRVAAQARYRVLRALLQSPAFENYAHQSHPTLAAPPPTTLLPCGPTNVTEQHILETVQVDESSYDGTDELCNKIWLEQMGYNLEEDKRRIGDSLLVWAGDQLTVDRIRGLARYRHDDPNSFARMEWLEPVFGWFHALMAFGNSLHAQYLGTSAGVGLRKAFEMLGRKGLIKTETKGVFWHNLDEALSHIAEANFLSLWMSVGGVKDLNELTKRTPEELLQIADEIVTMHASRAAYEKMGRQPDAIRDDCKRQTVMFCADVLSYLDLREAMKIGDVGRMEDLLPTMLYRFLGGGNHKYALEVLELLHKLRGEWPDELRDYIRRYCWLLNFTGARDSFLAVDMAQEHNIKDIKVTWRSFGPGATFPYIQKISPAIPVLRAVKSSIASQFPSVRGRGQRHGTPSKDLDVKRLVDMYTDARVHGVMQGRKIIGGPTDTATDFMSVGAAKLFVDGTVERWWGERSFPRATTEVYVLDDVD